MRRPSWLWEAPLPRLGTLDWIREAGWALSKHPFVNLCSWVWICCSQLSSSCSCDFTTLMVHSLELWPKITFSPKLLSLRVFYPSNRNKMRTAENCSTAQERRLWVRVMCRLLGSRSIITSLGGGSRNVEDPHTYLTACTNKATEQSKDRNLSCITGRNFYLYLMEALW